VVRAWVKLIWNSLGVAVVTAAAQLGIAQALGIVRWGESFDASHPSDWNAMLTWVGFIYAVAVLGGAAVGRRAVRRPGRPDGMAARVIAVLAAGLGAAAAVAIAWLPARTAKPPVNIDPELVVAMTAGAGIIVGILVALVAMSARPAAAGVRAAVAWIWFVGTASAVAGVVTHVPFDLPRLAVIDAPSLVPTHWWSGPNLMIGVAALLGFIVAGVARAGGAQRIGTALSGVTGPAMVAAAYLIAGPGSGSDRSNQLEPYDASLIAAGVGLCASVLVAVPGRRAERTTLWTQATHTEHPADDSMDDEPIIGEIIDVPPAPRQDVRQGVMGQPTRSFEQDYSDWLRELGHVPGAPPNGERQPHEHR